MNDQNVHPGALGVLSGSPWPDDHRRLTEILNDLGLSPRILAAESVPDAIAVLRRHPVQVAIVDRDLPDGTWRTLLDELQRLARPPLLIVTSALADDRLWAEVLNLGAFDVLMKPFDPDEVSRVVSWAFLRWREINPAGDGEEPQGAKRSTAARAATSGSGWHGTHTAAH